MSNITADPPILGKPDALPDADQQMAVLSSLLVNLDQVTVGPSSSLRAEASQQNRLAQVRLGVASSLFVALRAKHPPTAAHSLRVALICSSWASQLALEEKLRDELEVAALLHDVGKIGVPDHILLKPDRLTAEEQAVMRRHREHAGLILASCAASQNIIETIKYAPAWFDGSDRDFDICGDAIPVGCRVLAIVDAFDAMTTDHVYRRKLARERAVAELFQFAGTQFDPQLVRQFGNFFEGNHERLTSEAARRWLRDLKDNQSNDFWRLKSPLTSGGHPVVGGLFHEQLLENMQDCVVFVDSNLQILKWNRAMERLTGIPASSAEQRQWDPAMIQMRTDNFKLISVARCPVVHAVKDGECTRKRLLVTDASGAKVSIDAHVAPVHGADGVVYGATLLLQDASSQVSLEERVQTLNEKATQDGLTGAANRAEFDRAHAELVRIHLDRGTPYSLIICDLDHFKRINDTYGHQAGDDALVTFAALLKKFCRHGDLVARYGGEEFVLLCPDCDNATATQRAETIRAALARKPQPMLDGRCITASFGVTELQLGDNDETMLRRADRALLQAKDSGRNAVVQLGTGMRDEAKPNRQRRGWLSWWNEDPGDRLLERKLLTAVPENLAVEKIRGFVADHGAEIQEVEENHVTIRMDSAGGAPSRRIGDRNTTFIIDLRFQTLHPDDKRRLMASDSCTVIQVNIRPKRQRDRRKSDVDTRARQLLASIKAYLMAQDLSDTDK